MILTDGINTFTDLIEDIDEREILNSNTTITVGGKVKSQADSKRLRIESLLLLSQDDIVTINAIRANFAAEKLYTPVRRLYGKSSIEQIRVIIIDFSPQIKMSLDGSITYTDRIIMEEVI